MSTATTSSIDPRTDGMTATSPQPGAVLPWLGICPLMAGADTLVHGLVLGVVTLIALAGTAWVTRRAAVRGGTGATGLLLLGGGLAIILRLALEALAFELALALGGLFALLALQSTAAGCCAGSATPVAPGAAWWRTGLGGAAALVLAGGLRETLGTAGALPIAAFFLLAGCVVAWNAWQGARA